MDISQFQSIAHLIKDPFSHECIENIGINVTKYGCSATIFFKNGDTSGNQYISAVDYKELNEKIAEFLSALKSEL